MTLKRKTAIGLCLFLTITPFIGSYFSLDNTIGKYVGNLIPYIHLTMSKIERTVFSEMIDLLFGIAIFLIGLIGFIIFIVTKFRKTGGLLLLLYLTIIYLGMRALVGLAFNIISFSSYDTKAKIFIIVIILSEIIWGLFCYWATKILATEIYITSEKMKSTPHNNS